MLCLVCLRQLCSLRSLRGPPSVVFPRPLTPQTAPNAPRYLRAPRRYLPWATVALVSDTLDVALLRGYQQVDAPSAWTLSVETVSATPSGEAFAARIEGSIDAKASP